MIKKLRILWYINEIEAATAEYFYLKNLEDIMMFEAILGSMSKKCYDKLSYRVVELRAKRVELIVKLMEIELEKN